jgi:hypothetical protein
LKAEAGLYELRIRLAFVLDLKTLTYQAHAAATLSDTLGHWWGQGLIRSTASGPIWLSRLAKQNLIKSTDSSSLRFNLTL